MTFNLSFWTAFAATTLASFLPVWGICTGYEALASSVFVAIFDSTIRLGLSATRK